MEKFVTVMRQFKRMCDAHPVTECVLKCPFNELLVDAGPNAPCIVPLMDMPERAEAVIMKWALENPEP